MAIELPALPFAIDALEPQISTETLQYHRGKHHKAYVDKFNKAVEGTEWDSRTLEQVIKEADGGVFNNGAQAWNHTFYWNCLGPQRDQRPSGKLADAIERSFGGFEELERQFLTTALGQFGSGWAWLVAEPGGELAVTSTLNADNPLRHGKTPLLTCDVWEHAYYIDYRNARKDYVEAMWRLINWDAVARNLG